VGYSALASVQPQLDASINPQYACNIPVHTRARRSEKKYRSLKIPRSGSGRVPKNERGFPRRGKGDHVVRCELVLRSQSVANEVVEINGAS
jgi:hypothetical protein